ncbi:bifunctional [glutamate--ammonia ligase]-adenylyl-L-tyrosine phosphorylase/[glutamate--ammonia-ligase] adenylyltransferase [Pseudidiomarina taiwanensis]|uniref:Bifunctional glutamine synthetase adenylyltransferase/adenylyl-removing enzyme n=1 Tax=Pseudidiomarina taiwanensis TaxID=337250 RepID=A0A432ZM70_9GAMM|nr:bifunctional [glutamate--ammonia ligase]-adenylyl-L-tyrosine phosphorylase/[glutamate--ammonia-ligase] adenylyltransferase [Pseudidiomarina taiwanensis]RUO78983.1 bifunctional [glutamate--ammonia ligase]-adenylyl-L-tyrosine phosphorylase/[glutamate--ammonia-ligase] adenylyltransferase [Pseudidiomarina taiwanensis]
MSAKQQVCDYSTFIASVAASDDQFNTWLQQPQLTLPELAEYSDTLLQKMRGCDSEEAAAACLRQYRQRWLAQLASLDIVNEISVKQMLQRLSSLADLFISASYEWLYPRFCARYGTPRDSAGEPQPLLIVGMGKLGGRELNFSSDIDLMFTFPANGETDHPRKPIENTVFFTKLGQALIRLLDEITVLGRVYRVDMRLRPFGQSGPLVVSLAAFEQYYQAQGRDWERYAMVKARLIGASAAWQASFQNLIRPFVYRRYIDFSAIDALRKMKALIQQEGRRQALSNDIKLGPGGIREVEFIAQVFQLIRGGQQRSLQTSSLYQAYRAIAELGLLTPDDVDQLLSNYEFLRKLEHLLQERADEQTQRLPDCPQQQSQLAQIYQLDWPQLHAKIRSVMAEIHAQFNKVIGTQADDEESSLQILWQELVDESAVFEVLAEYGLDKHRAEQIWREIQQFRAEATRRPSGPRGRSALARLLPSLLEQLLPWADAEVVLQRILTILRSILSRTAYVELLVENKGACQQLLKLCRASQWVTDQLARYPLLLDELIDPQLLHQVPDLAEYPQLVRDYLIRIPEADLEAQMNALRQARKGLQLKIAAADISGSLPLMQVSDHLSRLAETILSEVIQQAWLQVTEKHGAPAGCNRQHTGLGVVAYGKLGGLELSYDSDLDLVFLTDSDYKGLTNGRKPIEVQQFYLRLVQRILHLFTTQTTVGSLYEVDIRLRPSGKAGLLISRVDTFADYLRDEAWTWESQALVRARPVFGEVGLRKQIEHVRTQQLTQPRVSDELRTEIIAMRDKMRAHQASDSLKHAPGGIVDLEFLVQFLVLNYAHQYPQLQTYTDNIRILEQAAEVGLITAEQSEQLRDSYLCLRQRIHRHALDGETARLDAETQAAREYVQQIWQQWLG